MAIRSEKIGEEEVKCRAIAENAQLDLDEAVPALQEAIKALESLNKKDMTEIKTYGRPPPLVEKVMEAVMILKGNEPTWNEAKRQLGTINLFFIFSVSVVILFCSYKISVKSLLRDSYHEYVENNSMLTVFFCVFKLSFPRKQFTAR